MKEKNSNPKHEKKGGDGKSRLNDYNKYRDINQHDYNSNNGQPSNKKDTNGTGPRDKNK